jgi:hypothetical protein
MGSVPAKFVGVLQQNIAVRSSILKQYGSGLLALDTFCLYFYGSGRSTADIDYYTAVPANLNLDEVGGEGSALAKKYKE